jgi:biotin carboxyl carrier protein
VTPLGDGRYLVVDGSRRQVAVAAREGGRTWVFLDGRVYVIGAPAPRGGRGRVRGTDESALTAPMPATVVAVNVEPGQQVTQGDVLVMLEAMKMELAIKAPRDATVVRVACRPGELVQPGVPLLELE